MYKYKGFGLHIESEIELPELIPENFEERDVWILVGKTPEALHGDGVKIKGETSFSASEFLTRVPGVACYYACYGRQLTVEPAEGVDIESVRVFLLGKGMAAILHQQMKVLLHASGILTDKGAVLFAGNSGAGKSTIAGILQKNGCRVFTDDMAVISPQHLKEEGKVYILPSYRIIRLWQKSIDHIGIDLKKEAHLQVRKRVSKFSLWNEDMGTEPARVYKIFLLVQDREAEEIEIQKLPAIEAFHRLRTLTYSSMMLEGLGLRKEHFNAMSALAAQTEVYELKRPAHRDTYNEMMQQLRYWIR